MIQDRRVFNVLFAHGAQETMEEEKAIHWQGIIRKYQDPKNLQSVWQILTCAIPYFALWFLMVQSLKIHFLLTCV